MGILNCSRRYCPHFKMEGADFSTDFLLVPQKSKVLFYEYLDILKITNLLLYSAELMPWCYCGAACSSP